MNKGFERFGYTATINNNLLTIKNPLGIVVKQTQYANFNSARGAWYGWLARRNLRIRPCEQDAVVIDIKVPNSEEPVPAIEEHSTCNKIANSLPLTAIIDFNFTNALNLPLTEWIANINDRIKSGEYSPSEIVRIRLVPNA